MPNGNQKYFKKGILYYVVAIFILVVSFNHFMDVLHKIQQGLNPCEKAPKWQNLLCGNDILILQGMIILVSIYAIFIAIDSKLLIVTIKNKLNIKQNQK